MEGLHGISLLLLNTTHQHIAYIVSSGDSTHVHNVAQFKEVRRWMGGGRKWGGGGGGRIGLMSGQA